MNKETYEALKRMMYHLRFVPKQGEDYKKDLTRLETWIDEVAKEYEEIVYCADCGKEGEKDDFYIVDEGWLCEEHHNEENCEDCLEDKRIKGVKLCVHSSCDDSGVCKLCGENAYIDKETYR